MANYFNPYMTQSGIPGAYYNPLYQQSGGWYGGLNYPVLKPDTIVPDQQGMKWVEGEVGAKAYQMPVGWPINQPIPLWDTTDTIIYLKSWNQMGMPNPLQKIKYVMVGEQNQMNSDKLNGMSGAMPSQSVDVNGMSGANHTIQVDDHPTNADFEALKEEIRNLKETAMALQASMKNNVPPNQNGTKNMNRGGNNNG